MIAAYNVTQRITAPIMIRMLTGHPSFKLINSAVLRYTSRTRHDLTPVFCQKLQHCFISSSSAALSQRPVNNQQKSSTTGAIGGGTSKARHHFHEECEQALNDHITMELQAYYDYTALAFSFYHDSVGLVNFAKYFKRQAEEELNHAHTMMEYLVKRGGMLRLQGIPAPAGAGEIRTALAAFERSLDNEKRVNDSLLQLHVVADRHKDFNFVDFIETPFLEEQVQALKAMSDLHSQLQKLGPGQGEVLFDRLILSKDFGNQPLVVNMQAGGGSGEAMKNSGNANTSMPTFI